MRLLAHSPSQPLSAMGSETLNSSIANAAKCNSFVLRSVVREPAVASFLATTDSVLLWPFSCHLGIPVCQLNVNKVLRMVADITDKILPYL